MQLSENHYVTYHDRFSLMPRFRNLHHFNEVVHIQFNDGSKFEDLAKVCLVQSPPAFHDLTAFIKQLLFETHNVLTSQKSKHGYLLLKCLRSFLTLDTLLSFEVHTEKTIKLGIDELQNFNHFIQVCFFNVLQLL